MSFRRRTYLEVLDNLLTGLTGGIAAETHPFPPPGGQPYRHNLERPPARDVVAVYGSRDGEPHAFRKDVDYKLVDDGRVVEWQAQAETPEPGTVVQVSYFPVSSRGALTDLHPGSVVRTMAESFALEVARLYAQLEVVYDAAFLDTANGKSLDNVVALLGVERVRGGRAAGELELTRAPNAAGAIVVPAGTRVLTSDGDVEYATTESVTLGPGQRTIRVRARDLEDNPPLDAGRLTVLAVPIAGIAGVTNPAPTAPQGEDETDDELRTRARNFLHGSERGTLGALKQAIARQQVTADVVEGGRVGPDGMIEGTPGVVTITPHVDSLSPELQQRLLAAIEDARPAGVLVKLGGPVAPRKVNLELRLTTAAGLLEQDLRVAHRGVRELIADYFARLPVREPGKLNQIVGLVLGVEGVEDVRIERAWTDDGTDVLDRARDQLAVGGFPTVLGELHIGDPNLPTLLTVTIAHPKDAPPDRPKVEAALAAALSALNAEGTAGDGEEVKRTVTYMELYDELLKQLPLPKETKVQFTLTLETGLSRVLASGPDAYELTPFERLALRPIELAVKGDGV